MTVSAQSVINRVQVALQDTTGIRWPEAELLLWLNDAQREIVLYKPDAGAVNEVMQLVPGTRQSIPATGNRLLRITRNMGSNDLTNPGRAVRIVSREILDGQYPDWHSKSLSAGTDAAHGATVKHYCYDEQDPRHFYVFPGVEGSAHLETVYSNNPVEITATTSDLTIPDIFSNAITDYILYRAYMKDAEYSANNERATTHFKLFMTSVTGKSQLDQVVGPNVSRDVVGEASMPNGRHPSDRSIYGSS